MSKPKITHIDESFEDLHKKLKQVAIFLKPRIRMLIELKKHEQNGISKRELADLISVNHNSIQTWRTRYSKGGIDLLLQHKLTGYKPSVITQEEHVFLNDILNDPFNGLRGYTELLERLQNKFNKEFKYVTLHKYCVRKFNSKIKVARKSHVNKDDEAVKEFKKNLLRSANNPLNQKDMDSKK